MDTPPETHRPGRRPKLTPAVVDTICQSRSIGMKIAECCVAAGVSQQSYNVWVKDARAELHRRDEGLDPDTDELMELKIRLYYQMEKANIVLKSRCLATWNRAATTDWRASRSLLISMFPESFAPNRDLVKAIEQGKRVDEAQAGVFLELVEQMIQWTAVRFALSSDDMNEMREQFAEVAETVLAAAQ